jgi:RNA-dependent RNA polymerase
MTVNAAGPATSLTNATDALSKFIRERIEKHLLPKDFPKPLRDIRNLFSEYQAELGCICVAHSVSLSESSRLSEEEVVAGTILAKTSQRARRDDLIHKMRQRARNLAMRVREELAGKEPSVTEARAGNVNPVPPMARLKAGCGAWTFALQQGEVFGAKSFGWIAMGVILAAVEALEVPKTNGHD